MFLPMKKLLISLGALTLLVATSTQAASTVSIEELFQSASFGYNQRNAVSVDSISATMITMVSPIIKDYGGENVLIYKMTYSPYLMEDLADTTNQSMLNEVKTKEVALRGGDTFVTLTLGTSDGLDASKNYYVMVTPIEMYDEAGTSSEQVCFNLVEERYGIGNACVDFAKEHGSFSTTPNPTTDVTITHGSPSSTDMSLANVTHTIAGNTITLRRVALEGTDKVDIFLFDLQDGKYVRLATVAMSAEKYTHTMTWDGEHIFRVIPLDGGKEVVYNVQAMRTGETPPPPPPAQGPVITDPPKTGPVENMIAVIVLSVAGYFLYRRYAKRYS